MGIQRHLEIDFQSEVYCNFITNSELRSFSDNEDIVTDWTSKGYDKKDERKLEESSFDRHSFRKTDYQIESRATGRVVNTVTVHDVFSNPCILQISAILFLKKNGMADDLSQRVQDAFKNVDVMDVDNAEAQFLREGVSYDDYHIALSFTLGRTADAILNDTNSQSFLDQIDRQLFAVREIAQTRVCTANDVVQDDSDVVIGDPDKPEPPILAHETEEMRSADCGDLDITAHRAGTVFSFIEFKTIWVLKEIKIGRCTVMKTHVPVLQTRENRQVLIAYVISQEGIKQLFEKAIRGCVEKAAIETGLLILITQGGALGAAITVFSTSCLQCLESKLSDDVRCLKPNLKIVTERDSWRNA